MSTFFEGIKALLGLSTYQKPANNLGYELDDDAVKKLRASIGGGQLATLPVTQTEWYLGDLRRAQLQADQGNLTMAAQLWAAMRGDGKAWGLRKTLTSGLVRLPRRLRGDPDLVAELEKHNGTRSAFDDMFPPSELALFVDDGHGLGVAVGELLPVQGRDIPVFCRLEPEFLTYRFTDNRWFYRSLAGLLPITPGDGRWILHTPGGRVNPWRNGLWRALGRAYINKDHALSCRANYSSKLANPARVAVAPPGATEPQRIGFIARLMAWGINTVFELPPGWDVKLIESNGRGFDVFQAEITTSDEEMTISVLGQLMTTEGGKGFSNGDMGEIVRQDIIQDVADSLCHTLNTQGLPYFTFIRKGIAAIASGGVTVEYITKKPKDHEAQGRTMQITANGIAQMRAALGPDGKKPDTTEITTQFGIPVVDMTPEEVAEFKAAAKPMSDTESAQQVAQDTNETPPGRNGERGTKSEQKAAREASPGGSAEDDAA